MQLDLRSCSLRACLVVFVGFLLTGCTTVPTEEQRMQAGVVSDLRNIHEDLNRINGRQEQIEASNDELRQQIRTFGAGRNDTEKRFGAVEERLKAMDVAREADKRDVIEQLSKTIADVINGHRGATERVSSGGGQASGVQGSTIRSVSGGIEHVVKEKESLTLIAQKYGVTVEAIVTANRLKNVDFVRVGQRLTIPR